MNEYRAKKAPIKTAPKPTTMQDKYIAYKNLCFTDTEKALFQLVDEEEKIILKDDYIYYHIDEHAHYRVMRVESILELLEEYIKEEDYTYDIKTTIESLKNIIKHIDYHAVNYINVYHYETFDEYTIGVAVCYIDEVIKNIVFNEERSSNSIEDYLVELFKEKYL